MSLCRLFPLWAIACIAVGIGTATFAGWSVITGAMIGCSASVAPLVALTAICVVFTWWRPDVPPCRCGETRCGGYDFIGPTSGPYSEETSYEYRCPKCGRCFKSNAGIFVECRPDGSTIPYMRVSRWGRWRLDLEDARKNYSHRAIE